MAEAPPSPPGARGGRGVRTGLLVAVTFVLGLAGGALTVGLLVDPPAPTAPSGAQPSTSRPPGGPLPNVPTSAEFRANEACLRALNAAQDAYLVMDDLAEAAAALDAARLDEAVRRLQPLEAQLQADLAACQVTADADGGTDPGAAPTPSLPAEPAPPTAEPAPSPEAASPTG